MRNAEAFKPLKFGTSCLRDKIENMTDMECYINTKGFIAFLEERGEIDPKNRVVALAGDLRGSTPRIMSAVAKAVSDSGCTVACCGYVPTTTLTYFSIVKEMPGIMVTGSHIPEDRNGIKFTKKTGEVLKSDEADILRNVATAREKEYAKADEEDLFDEVGMFKEKPASPKKEFETEAIDIFIARYLDVFKKDTFSGKKIVLYQHSAVGRDLVKAIFEGLGAEVIAVGRSDVFIPVDTEKVSSMTIDILKDSASKYNPFVVISTDGDSDRPLLADENGEFLTGDKLGALVSLFLNPDFAAVPISANDAIVDALGKRDIEVAQTKIGSPYVIAAMNEKLAANPKAKVVSWESNGGFLTGSDWQIEGKTLKALPTRDSVLPLIAAALLATQEGKTVSALIKSSLPERYTHADVVDDKTPGCEKYTADMGKALINILSPKEESITKVDFSGGSVQINGSEVQGDTLTELKAIKDKLSSYFTKDLGFEDIQSINFTDGIRIVFSNRDVAHIRPSGNAPEFRMYATSNTQERADEIVETRKKIVPQIVADMENNPPRSLGAQAAGENVSTEKVAEAVSAGKALFLLPYKEPKVWGEDGIGEYWYGAEAGEKSSIAVCGEDTAPMSEVLEIIPEKILGAPAIEKFGNLFPLVKILTPKGRLSVQFHDAKNELWIVTAAKGEARLIVGFSELSVKEHGEKVTEKYSEALTLFGEKLNKLIDYLEGASEECKNTLKKEKDVIKAAENLMGSDSSIAELLEALMDAKSQVESFYNYKVVKVGDVIPIASGTLHALGAGVEVVEPQIPGPTQSLEDGATYPVRYYFPGYKREGSKKELDIDRAGEMKPEVAEESLPVEIASADGCAIERLPGGFEDKGLEVHRIDMEAGSEFEVIASSSFHNLVTVKGSASCTLGGENYAIPKAEAGGKMLIIPACVKSYRITASEKTQIIDTFMPV